VPLDFAGFDASVRATKRLEDVCKELGLDEVKCKRLEGAVGEICGALGGAGAGKAKRARSRWQECIAKERAGKAFDPQAIKELSKLYKAGKCP